MLRVQIGLLATIPLVAFQATSSVSHKSALERRGLHHTDIRGRIVSPSGEPVSDVRVQLNAGAPRALPLAETLTGPDGVFTFRDVTSAYPPDLRWYPPEGWLRGAMPLIGESWESIDAGTIHLQPDTIIRLATEIVGGSSLGPGDRKPVVVLQSSAQFGSRIVAEDIGDYMVLRQVPFDDGILEVRLFANRRSEVFTAPLHVQRGSRDRMITLRLNRDSLRNTDYGAQGTIDIKETILSPAAVDREFVASGKIIAPDGTPIEGAIASINDFPFRRHPPQWTSSNDQGKFKLTYRSATCDEVNLVHAGSGFWIFPRNKSDAEETCETRWKNPRDVEVPLASRLMMTPSGIAPGTVTAYWWHESFGWQRFSSLQPWIPLSNYPPKIVKLEAPGFLPVVQELKLPRINASDGEKAPPEVRADFHFEAATRRKLTVLGDGKPLAGATVDVEFIHDLNRDQRYQLVTYKTGADGRIELKADPEQLAEVYVYADGFEPRRAMWDPDTTVDLVPRGSALLFTAHNDAFIARIRDVATPQAARTLRLSKTQTSKLPVAKGTYDVVTYDGRGGILAYQRIVVGAGEAKEVDLKTDERPRLTVRYPSDGWVAGVSESAPRGGATGWVAMIAGGGTLTFQDTPAVVERKSPREVVLRISHAGKMHLEALQQAQAQVRFWRDIDFRPGDSVSVDVPGGDATLKGSMRTYDGGAGFAMHGWAGPRMQLIADDPKEWSVTDYLPKRDGENKDKFTLAGLPPGTYHLYQHLIGKPETSTYSGKEFKYTSPIAAWGGVPVILESGRTTQLLDFMDYAFQPLQVRVTDLAARPLDNATVRIRDRMSESWRQVEENPAQLEQAAHPIPYPAAARLKNGGAVLPNVRTGWLDISVELDDGSVYGFNAIVSPPDELRLTVPVR